MQISGLGIVQRDSRFPEWYRSEPIALPLLKGQEGIVVVSGYDSDTNQKDFSTAISNLLHCPFEVFRQAEPYIFKYYEDINTSMWSPDDPEYLVISSPEKVWEHIQVGREAMVSRRLYGDKAIYVSFECECDWEPEHGLQIVLKNGCQLVKVGAFDGHLTNSDAFDDPSFEHVIYPEA